MSDIRDNEPREQNSGLVDGRERPVHSSKVDHRPAPAQSKLRRVWAKRRTEIRLFTFLANFDFSESLESTQRIRRNIACEVQLSISSS